MTFSTHSSLARPRFLAPLFAATSLLALPAHADFNDAPPNAASQQPAFAGQTRAPVIAPQFNIETAVITDRLDSPWGMAILPDGTALVTEKRGNLRRIAPTGEVSAPISGLPDVDTRGQGGLLDVAIAPDFAQTRQIWITYAEPRGGRENGTAVATGRLSQDMTALEDLRVIFQQQPAWASDKHFGSRLVFGRDGSLFVTTGERSDREPRQLAQDLTTHLGKVLRIDPQTGQAAPGNPQFTGVQAQPEIWSYGHRNLQSAALDPATGQIWTVEHGPRGGDELNHPEAGKNYGWPVITYGQEYSGAAVGQGRTQQDGLEQPVYYWDPVIAPSGMAFYQGGMFPEMQGDILIGGLQGQALVRLTVQDGRVTGEQRLAEGIGRVRDLDIAADGAIWMLIEDSGELVRLSRAN